MNCCKNVGTIDRTVRIVIGIVAEIGRWVYLTSGRTMRPRVFCAGRRSRFRRANANQQRYDFRACDSTSSPARTLERRSRPAESRTSAPGLPDSSGNRQRNTFSVPTSHQANTRTCGHAAGLRPRAGRPKTRALASLSATSRTKPSRAIIRGLR